MTARRPARGLTAEERLARRYWDLLDFYPRWFRDQRGEELVGTLLDCAHPGQTRPTWREARALVLEGLRLRAGASGHRPVAATVARGLQVGVLLLVATTLIENVTDLATRRGYEDVRPVTGGWAVLAGLAVLALVVPFVLVARGRVGWALPFVAVAGAVDLVGFPWLLRSNWAQRFPLDDGTWSAPLVFLHPGFAVVTLLATTVLVRWRPPPAGPATVTTVAVLPTLLFMPEWLEDAGLLPRDFPDYLPLGTVLVVLYLGVIGYAVVDARPAMATAVVLSVWIVEPVGSWITLDRFMFDPVTAALIVPLYVAAWLGARRQARLPAGGVAA